MMEGINLYSIEYYKKTVFKGSYRGICFRIAKDERETGFDADEGSSGDVSMSGGTATEDCLRVQAWKGPFIMEKTDEEVFTEFFEYSDEGLKEANEWLEQKQREIA